MAEGSTVRNDGGLAGKGKTASRFGEEVIGFEVEQNLLQDLLQNQRLVQEEDEFVARLGGQRLFWLEILLMKQLRHTVAAHLEHTCCREGDVRLLLREIREVGMVRRRTRGARNHLHGHGHMLSLAIAKRQPDGRRHRHTCPSSEELY